MADTRRVLRPRRKIGDRFYYNCAVTGCLNTTSNSNLTFFTVPIESQRRLQWLERVRREDLIGRAAQHARICEIHFDPLDVLTSTKRKVLKQKSLPRWVEPGKQYINKQTQTTDEYEYESYNFMSQFAVKTEHKDRDHILTQLDIQSQLLDKATRMEEVCMLATSQKSQQLSCAEVMEEDFTQTENAPLQDHTYMLPQTSASETTPVYDETYEQNALVGVQSKQIEKAIPEDLNFMQLCDKFLNKNLAEIVKEQCQGKTKNSGMRYSKEYKLFCLRLLYTSPEAYSLLKDTLCLPTKQIIDYLIMPLTVEANSCLMYILECKISATPNMDRNCFLVVDTLTLNEKLFYHAGEDRMYGFHDINEEQSPELAKNALVAMVHGISDNYTQIVGYAFLREELTVESVNLWIEKLIQRLFNVGLNVRVMISTLTPDFLEFASKRSVTIATPYFYVDKNMIYYIFDPPHLMTMVRDNLMKYNFKFKTKGANTTEEAKWEFIQEFYQYEKTKEFRIAPTLTEEHLQPFYHVSSLSMRVELAVQLLSYPVATGMSTFRDFGVLSPSAGGTIKLIKIMNDLIEFLNISELTSVNEFKNSPEYQICFLKDIIDFFASLKLCDPSTGQDATVQAKFIDGFRITLNSMYLMYKDLQKEHLMESNKLLIIKKLNRDCLERCFTEMLSNIKTRIRDHSLGQLSSWQLVTAVQKIIIVSDWGGLDKNKKFNNDPRNLLLDRSFKTLDKEEDITENDVTGVIKLESDIDIEEHLLSEAVTRQLPMTKREEDVMVNTLECESKDNNKPEPVTRLKRPYNKNKTPSISQNDFFGIELPTKHALIYVSEFLMDKCSRFCKHEDCMFLHKGDSFNWYDAYCLDGGKKIIYKPSDEFVNFVKSLDKVFVEFFQQTKIDIHILKSLLVRAKTVTYEMPCEYMSIDYCKELFFRARICLTVKANNDNVITVLKKSKGSFVKLIRHKSAFFVNEL